MAVYFSGASIDERGQISGGKAGDQGNEVRTCKAYNHKLGWRVFRYPNANIAKWIGTNAKVMADNQNFGYDQSQRLTGYNAAIKAGWEPANVKTPVEVDCSSLVRTCVACALEREIPNFNTSTEPNILIGLGFIEIKNWTLDSLQVGDIVCTKSKGHTEVVSSGVSTVVAAPAADCYPKYTGTSYSIVDGLRAVGEKDTSYNHRLKIARANGVSAYLGTSKQNASLLTLLRAGRLKKA